MFTRVIFFAPSSSRGRQPAGSTRLDRIERRPLQLIPSSRRQLMVDTIPAHRRRRRHHHRRHGGASLSTSSAAAAPALPASSSLLPTAPAPLLAPASSSSLSPVSSSNAPIVNNSTNVNDAALVVHGSVMQEGDDSPHAAPIDSGVDAVNNNNNSTEEDGSGEDGASSSAADVDYAAITLSHEMMAQLIGIPITGSYPYRRSLHAMLFHHIHVHMALRNWVRELEAESESAMDVASLSLLRQDLEESRRILIVYSAAVVSFQEMAKGK